jgi:hypothetical protein
MPGRNDIIANWTGGNSAVVVYDNSASGAVYKGLALLNSTFLLGWRLNLRGSTSLLWPARTCSRSGCLSKSGAVDACGTRAN